MEFNQFFDIFNENQNIEWNNNEEFLENSHFISINSSNQVIFF